MKLCPHCAASLEDDTVKCKRCGKWTVPIRDIAVQKKKKRTNWIRLTVLGGLAVMAWAVWALPEGTINTTEILDLNPDRQTALRTMRADLNEQVTLQEDHFGLNGSFSANPSALRFTASEGVVYQIRGGDLTGHTGLTIDGELRSQRSPAEEPQAQNSYRNCVRMFDVLFPLACLEIHHSVPGRSPTSRPGSRS